MEVDPLAPLYLPSKELHKVFHYPYKMKKVVSISNNERGLTLVRVGGIVPSTNA